MNCTGPADCLAASGTSELLVEDRHVVEGYEHLYRVRAVDDLDNASAYSAPIDAGVPLPPPIVSFVRAGLRYDSWTLEPCHQLDEIWIGEAGDHDAPGIALVTGATGRLRIVNDQIGRGYENRILGRYRRRARRRGAVSRLGRRRRAL